MAIVGTSNASVPGDPTTTTIVTEALRRGGRVNPTSAEITSAIDNQLQEVKSDIRRFAGLHPDLLATTVTTMTRGVSIYTWPTDAHKIRTVSLLNSPTDGFWRSTAQAGAAASITLSASFDEDEGDVVGKWIVTTGGVGPNQYRQISVYNNGTKVATISADGNWDTTPDNTTTYMLIDDHKQLWQIDKPTEWDRKRTPWSRGTPTQAAMVGLELNLNLSPDIGDTDLASPDTLPFVILWDYWFDIDRLDETAAPFVRMLREWRSLWIQGVAVKTMQRYDDDRYQLELQVYQVMLDGLAAKSSDVAQVRYQNL